MPEIGDSISLFEVMSANGTIFHFPADVVEDLLVFVVYRKNDCAPCRVQLNYLSEDYVVIKAAGAELVALSYPPPEESIIVQEELNLPYRLLCDPEANLLEQLGAINAEKLHAAKQIHSGLVYPTIFLFEKSGKVRFKLETKRTATQEEFESIYTYLG
ncbi:MAG TPA: redoxin domain-containing protein [Candidatus Lokiarchaeia archaeon]|nr:redoxin domain-containing protein [Candidatus Lokiarchaeia archaeon]